MMTVQQTYYDRFLDVALILLLHIRLFQLSYLHQWQPKRVMPDLTCSDSKLRLR